MNTSFGAPLPPAGRPSWLRRAQLVICREARRLWAVARSVGRWSRRTWGQSRSLVWACTRACLLVIVAGGGAYSVVTYWPNWVTIVGLALGIAQLILQIVEQWLEHRRRKRP